WKLAGKPARDFRGTYEAFLQSCREQAPYDVFVDGEKSILKFMTLASMGLPVGGVIHLYRDPRGYAASCCKYTTPQPSAAQAGLGWARQHKKIDFFTGLFWHIPVFTLRYEDLARRPQAVMDEVYAFM